MTRALLFTLALTSAKAGLSEEPKPASGQVLNIEQAVQMALEKNPRMKATRALTSAQDDMAKSSRGHLLPTLALSVIWNDAWAKEDLGLAELVGPILGGGGGMGMGPQIPQEVPLKNLQVGLGTLAVAQPITGLFHLGAEYASAADQADAANEDQHAQEGDLRLQVETGFLSLFEARALIGIAKASRSQLQDQLDLTQVEYKAGVLTRADVLRVQVAVANADQQMIQAEVQEQVSKASLLTVLGLSPETRDVEFAEPADLEKRQGPGDFVSAEQFALSHRHEITSASFNEQAAHETYLANAFNFLPELTASGSYMRLQGLPAGIPQDFFLIGVNLKWAIFQWGSTYYQARAASFREDAAAARVEGTRQQVSLEVEQRLAEERAAAHAVSVAQEAIQQAEEAYRVTEALVKAGSATTTDLLDAQSALTQAKLNLIRARYQDLRARSSLTRALGA